MENSKHPIRERPPITVVTFQQRMMYEELYDDITNNGVTLQFQDRHALAELAVNIVHMIDLRQEITDKGTAIVVEGDKGSTITKRNPAIDVLQKVQPVVIRLFKSFKMTPDSRKTAGIPAFEGAPNDGWDDEV